MIRRFHEAKENNAPNVTIWGTGSALREFLYADDLADACIYLMQNYDDGEIVNIGSGEEVSTKYLASLVKKTVGY
jgi:GDP-L-fucose synthase